MFNDILDKKEKFDGVLDKKESFYTTKKSLQDSRNICFFLGG